MSGGRPVVRPRTRWRVVGALAATLALAGTAPGPAGASGGSAAASPTGGASGGPALAKERLYELARQRSYGTPVLLDVGPGDVNAGRVTDSGVVVGSVEVGEEWRTFRWRDGVTELMPPQDADLVSGGGLNDLGEMVFSTSSWFDGWGNAAWFVWQADGTVRSLGPKGTWLTVDGITDDGTVVGTLPGFRLATWRDGVTTELPAPDGRPVSLTPGAAINERGEIAGQVSVPGIGSRAHVWRDGVATPLPTPDGASSSAARITDAGDVLGSIDHRQVLWEDGVRVRDVDRDNRFRLGVTDVNAHGVVVGNAGRTHLRGPVRTNARGVTASLPGLGGTGGWVYAVHDLDIAVGSSYRAGGDVYQPVMWVLTVPVPLGTRVGGVQARGGEARDINSSGLVVGSLILPGDGGGVSRAVLWDLTGR